MDGPVVYDSDAWIAYPQHRKWFNKLEFSLLMGYDCGPCGVAPSRTDSYIVRPIYNLSGMSAGAFKKYIEAGDVRSVPAGSFWCEWFEGPQHSVTYKWSGSEWLPESSWRSEVDVQNLWKFKSWTRSNFAPEVPTCMNSLTDVGIINVEWIGGRPIEVHLRPSPDPEDGDELIPVWADDPVSDYVKDFDDADGNLTVPRLGFIVRR